MAEKKTFLEEAAEKMPSGQAEKAESRFSKEQLAASERFRDRRDILEALLVDGELYTAGAVEEKIEKYMKGKVR